MKSKAVLGREIIKRIKPMLSSASIGDMTLEVGVNEAVWLNVKVLASKEILNAIAGVDAEALDRPTVQAVIKGESK